MEIYFESDEEFQAFCVDMEVIKHECKDTGLVELRKAAEQAKVSTNTIRRYVKLFPEEYAPFSVPGSYSILLF